jgi:methylphosphotriester-DNA--protein-cysteine methyltransferase
VSEEKRTPAQEWARAQGLELHGMTDEQWDSYLWYLEDENRDKLAEVFKRLVVEASNLRVALRDDKQARPENQEQRMRLNRSLRELRARRLADIRSRVPLDEGYEEEDAFEAIVEETLEDYMRRLEEREDNDE